MPRPPEFEGTYFSIRCLELADGSCPAGTFLDSLSAGDRRKLDVLFEMLGNSGKIWNTEKFKKLEGSDNIWEFKSFQVRIPCFFAQGRKVILLFGLIKKKDKYNAEEIERAERYRDWYLGQFG